MYYDPEKNDHGLRHNPFKSCVTPRPIGWISTVSPEGIHNLAPYSQFQNLTFDPPYVMFSANQNTQGKRMATYELREAVNRSAAEVPPDVDEFELAGVTKAPSIKIKPCRVAESPVHFECVYHQTLRLPGNGLMGTVDIIIGRVVLIHIKDEVIHPDGRIDILKIRPLARLGYYDYTTIDSTFEMVIPGENKLLLDGLEGFDPSKK
jgi:flavin reductase (DIM6/NTAB) family NADH-FMN oxidoreductase RutF